MAQKSQNCVNKYITLNSDKNVGIKGAYISYIYIYNIYMYVYIIFIFISIYTNVSTNIYVKHQGII